MTDFDTLAALVEVAENLHRRLIRLLAGRSI